ncbi:MAG: cell wall hydrolase [Pseudomonadota bacterium]
MRTLTGRTADEVRNGLILTAFLLAVGALFITMVRTSQMIETAAAEPELAAEVVEVEPEEPAPSVEVRVVSAVEVLMAGGFDGNAVARDLILAGIPAHAFAIPAAVFDQPFDEFEADEHACLSQAIYFEARNQSVLGQIAVADVILNRVDHGRFPDTVCGVVFQGEERRHRCQFSFACDGVPETAHEKDAWAKSEALADLIMRGFRPPLTRYATFYHAEYVSPGWAKAFVETTVIGDHIFYRYQDALRIAAQEIEAAPAASSL